MDIPCRPVDCLHRREQAMNEAHKKVDMHLVFLCCALWWRVACCAQPYVKLFRCSLPNVRRASFGEESLLRVSKENAITTFSINPASNSNGCKHTSSRAT